MNILTHKWAGRFINLAIEIASWSKDDSTKIGCVIVNDKGHPVSFGYNGLPMGIDDNIAERDERPEKYFWYEHAERNAMYLTTNSLQNCSIFITHAPCADCARGMIQSGIKNVIIHADGGFESPLADRYGDSMIASREMLTEANIGLFIYSEHILQNISTQ